MFFKKFKLDFSFIGYQSFGVYYIRVVRQSEIRCECQRTHGFAHIAELILKNIRRFEVEAYIILLKLFIAVILKAGIKDNPILLNLPNVPDKPFPLWFP